MSNIIYTSVVIKSTVNNYFYIQWVILYGIFVRYFIYKSRCTYCTMNILVRLFEIL